MALIPITEWIDRFGVLEELSAAEERPPQSPRTALPRVAGARKRAAAAKEVLRAFLKEAWARQSLSRLTLRRG